MLRQSQNFFYRCPLLLFVFLLSVSFISTHAQTLQEFSAPISAEKAKVELSNRIEGEMILLLRKPITPDSIEQKWRTWQGRPTHFRHTRTLSRQMNIHLFTYDTSTVDGDALLEALRASPEMKLAQFNHNVEERPGQNFPNDPSFGDQWGMHNTGQTGGTTDADIDGPEAWDCVTGGLTREGDTIVVAVIDGGADIYHEDIDFWKNYDEIPGNNVDDDNNGYEDDYDGWDAYNSDGTVPDDDHGTHVSGIAGAIGNNGIGVTGVNWNVQIMPIAGSSSDEATVVAAYDYVLTQRKSYNRTNGDSGAFVVSTNSSFGVNYGDPADYPIWCSMYDSMGEAGILSAAATMNIEENVDQVGDVPTACPSDHLISVTNTTDTDMKNDGAAYGDTTIDIGAPGTDIYSTESGDTYGYKTGTSMASPHVAGAVGLMFAAKSSRFIQQYKQYPDSFAYKVKQELLLHVDSLNDLSDSTVSEGRLNIYNPLKDDLQLNANYTTSQSGLTVTFMDSATNADTYNWDFGDGNTATGDTVTHTYADTGSYQVCLMVESSCGSDTTCDSIDITCQPPIADFTYSSDSTSDTVIFTNQSTSATDFQWDFGDGDTDTVEHPTHVYPDTGTYSVQLIVSSSCGTDTVTKSVQVRCVIPSASFTYGTNDLEAQFNSNTTIANEYHWTFGDGDSSSLPDPLHTYPDTGDYQVCLMTTNSCGTDTTCQMVTITCQFPSASFGYTVNNDTVLFTDSSSNTTDWSWSFGDGDTSTQQNPTHVYGDTGTYNVQLIAANSCGNDTMNQTVTIQCQSPTAAFGFTKDTLTVHFTDSSQFTTDWQWSFGDGDTSSQANPNHTYSDTGDYQVCLVSTNYCDTDTVCQMLSLNCTFPVADFEYVTDSLTATFSNLSNNAGSLKWYFGDGNTTTIANPSHQYDQNDTYHVCLEAVNNCGVDSVCQWVQITGGPTGIEQPPGGSELVVRPNPFHQSTNFEYHLSQASQVRVEVVNVLGQTVSKIVKPQQSAGRHKLTVDLSSVPPGMYYYRFRTGSTLHSGKLLMTK